MFAANAGDVEAGRACVQATIERFGGLDILVNNVGTNPHFGSTLDVDPAQYDKTFEVNLRGPLFWTKHAWELAFRDTPGVVVNIASVGGLRAEFGLGVYNLTKAALIHLTRQLADELGPTRVVGVAPGLVQTDFAALLVEHFGERMAARLPTRRLGEPADVANLVTFLASDARQLDHRRDLRDRRRRRRDGQRLTRTTGGHQVDRTVQVVPSGRAGRDRVTPLDRSHAARRGGIPAESDGPPLSSVGCRSPSPVSAPTPAGVRRARSGVVVRRAPRRSGAHVCAGCGYRSRCLDLALVNGERTGVWGGLTPAERERLPDAVVLPLRPRRPPGVVVIGRGRLTGFGATVDDLTARACRARCAGSPPPARAGAVRSRPAAPPSPCRGDPPSVGGLASVGGTTTATTCPHSASGDRHRPHVGHAGWSTQDALHRLRPHVLAAGDDEVAAATVHVQAPVGAPPPRSPVGNQPSGSSGEVPSR